MANTSMHTIMQSSAAAGMLACVCVCVCIGEPVLNKGGHVDNQVRPHAKCDGRAETCGVLMGHDCVITVCAMTPCQCGELGTGVGVHNVCVAPSAAPPARPCCQQPSGLRVKQHSGMPPGQVGHTTTYQDCTQGRLHVAGTGWSRKPRGLRVLMRVLLMTALLLWQCCSPQVQPAGQLCNSCVNRGSRQGFLLSGRECYAWYIHSMWPCRNNILFAIVHNTWQYSRSVRYIITTVSEIPDDRLWP